jgi:hypothetical protein
LDEPAAPAVEEVQKSVTGEALRAAFFAIGSTLIAVAELDDGLVAAGIPALGLISPVVSKVLLGLGMLAMGYAKTGKIFGDVNLPALIGSQLAEKHTVKPSEARATDPGVGPGVK